MMYISCISVSNWWLCGRISLIVSQKYHCNESDGDSSFFKSPGCSDSDSFLKCIRIAVTVIVFSKVQVAWKAMMMSVAGQQHSTVRGSLAGAAAY